MRMVPALSEMKLLAGRRCQRPVSMTMTMDLKDEKVEVPAGCHKGRKLQLVVSGVTLRRCVWKDFRL